MNAISPLTYGFAARPQIPYRPVPLKMGAANDNAPAIIDSPLASLAMDLAAAIPSAMIAYEYQGRSNWSNFFWVVAGVTGLKAFIDASRIQLR